MNSEIKTVGDLIEILEDQDPDAKLSAQLLLRPGQITDPFELCDLAVSPLTGRVSFIVEIGKTDAEVLRPIYGLASREECEAAAKIISMHGEEKALEVTDE